MCAQPYSKPKPIGGRLIRDVVAFLKAQDLSLPIAGPVWLAVSGGPDSMALAHLLIRYGRRIVAKEQISLVHVDHGWREGKSSKDALFVKKYAGKMGVPIFIHKLTPPKKQSIYQGRSWEEVARQLRKELYAKVTENDGGVVFTGHQGDDLAETLLWRLFTGAASTHGGGIKFRAQNEVRPFLGIRKARLISFLAEEGIAYCEDETNFEGRFLRSRIRKEILPSLEGVFPRAIEHLIGLGLDAQRVAATRSTSMDASRMEAFQSLFAAAGIRGRRNHWEALDAGQPAMDLPGGWRLTRVIQRNLPEKWVLEKIKEH